jgi:hypothetical protein
MKFIPAALIGLLVLGAAHSAAAQDAAVNVSRLGIDLKKIQIKLRESAETQGENHGLKIRYTVAVYGQAPQIEFFNKQDVLPIGPAQYGAPTHQEMLYQMTPKEFRAPIMDFSALLRWLADRNKK